MNTNYAEIFAIGKIWPVAEEIKQKGGVINEETHELQRVDGLAYTLEGLICPLVKGAETSSRPIGLLMDRYYHWSELSGGGPTVHWDENETLSAAIDRTHMSLSAEIAEGKVVPYVACVEMK